MEKRVVEKLEKVPPHSVEAEKCLLGALLQERDIIPPVIEILPDAEAFYFSEHKLIYESILNLFEKNKPVDPLTLSEELGQKKLEEVGGIAYLAELVDSPPTTLHAVHYAELVKGKHILRQLLKVCNEISGMVYEGEEEPDRILDKAQNLMFDITRERIRDTSKHIKEVLLETVQRIEIIAERKDRLSGVPTGFYELDKLTCGFQPSHLVVIAGRPSVGKTAFALNIMRNASVDHSFPVAIFTLESPAQDIALRLLSAEGKIEGRKIRRGYMEDEEWERLTEAASTLQDAPIFIDESKSFGLNILELRAKARRLRQEKKVELIIIDYLQLLEPPRRMENRQQEIAKISHALKSLAKELGIPIVALSQLSRSPEKREDKRPLLSDLRESGAIEQDADLVLSLYREELHKPTPEKEGRAEVIISKQRSGPVGTVELVFIKEYAKFENPGRF